MATHQSAIFCIYPRLSHERAVHRIAMCLKGTKDKGMVFRPDGRICLECDVGTEFTGGWDKADSGNPDAMLSRTGCVLIYDNCLVLFCSKSQTEIALSAVEA